MEWLNNILTIIFYSERITNLMINSYKTWNINYRIFKILKIIITKYLKSYKIINSLSKLINSYVYYKAYKEGLIIENDYLIKHYDIIKLFKQLNIKLLEIIIIGKNKYINLYKITTLDKYDKTLISDEIVLDNEIEIDNNPDVLFIIHDKLNKTIITEFNNFKQDKNLNMFKYDIQISDIIFDKTNITEIINFNDNEYILDSIIFKNNKHTLVGFTNNKEKYIYKGWYKKEYNPINLFDNNISICNFKKVHNFNFKYYLKENDCNLYNIDDTECDNPNNYCFNIDDSNNRDIILIYVKKDITIDRTIKYNNYDEIINIDDIIQNLYEIKKLNSEQVRYELDLLGVMANSYYNYSKDDLKYILYDTIKSHFTNTKSPLKSPLIKDSISSIKSINSTTN